MKLISAKTKKIIRKEAVKKLRKCRCLFRRVSKKAKKYYFWRNFNIKKLVTNFKKSIFQVSNIGLVILMIICLNSFWILNIANTKAYFTDISDSSDNSYDSGTLDFSITAGNWSPQSDVLNMNPGDSISKDITITNDGSLGFQYSLDYEKVEGDDQFCSYLKLDALLNGSSIYSGNLVDLNSLPAGNFSDPAVLNMTISLPAGSPDFGESGCGFKFVIAGWQESLSYGQGYSHTEEDSNYLSAASKLVSVADAYVMENNPAINYGTSTRMDIRSNDSAVKRRSYIKFNFGLPSGTEILSANLRLYMPNAPAENRTYGTKRVEAPWSEYGVSGINWSNQPIVSGAVSATTQTGTADNAWVNWDVTNDVAGFVNGSFNNNGWQIADVDESSATNTVAVFRTRESANAAIRPVLEITFKAPTITTDHVVINEIYYNATNTTDPDAGTLHEWLELYNPTDSDVDISGWKICDSLTLLGNCDTIPNGNILEAKKFAVISAATSTWALWPEIPADALLIIVPGGKIGGDGFDNNGDEAVLREPDNTKVDQIIFDYSYLTGNEDTYMNPSGHHKSIARIIKGYDTDSFSDWIVNAFPNPGTNPSEGAEEMMRFLDDGVIMAKDEAMMENIINEMFADDVEDEGNSNDEITDEPVMEELVIKEEIKPEPLIEEQTAVVEESEMIMNPEEDIDNTVSDTGAMQTEEPAQVENEIPKTEEASNEVDEINDTEPVGETPAPADSTSNPETTPAPTETVSEPEAVVVEPVVESVPEPAIEPSPVVEDAPAPIE
jgi:hypothetical protein